MSSPSGCPTPRSLAPRAELVDFLSQWSVLSYPLPPLAGGGCPTPRSRAPRGAGGIRAPQRKRCALAPRAELVDFLSQWSVHSYPLPPLAGRGCPTPRSRAPRAELVDFLSQWSVLSYPLPPLAGGGCPTPRSLAPRAELVDFLSQWSVLSYPLPPPAGRGCPTPRSRAPRGAGGIRAPQRKRCALAPRAELVDFLSQWSVHSYPLPPPAGGGCPTPRSRAPRAELVDFLSQWSVLSYPLPPLAGGGLG